MIDLDYAVRQFADGQPVLVGDPHAEEPIFLVAPAATIGAVELERLQSLSGGDVILGLGGPVLDRLNLPAANAAGREGGGLRLTATIDAATMVSGGWSLVDRATTMRVAADPASVPEDLVVPGHVVTASIAELGSDSGAAAVELAAMAGQSPAVVLCPVLDGAGHLAGLRELRRDLRLARLPLVSAAELRSRACARQAEHAAVACELPTREGAFRAVGFGADNGDAATVAMVYGEPALVEAPLIHVHVACRFGDAFGSLLCDCRAQLDTAVSDIVAEGAGVIIYVQPDVPGAQVCTRDQPVDAALVSGLLRAVGVTAVRPSARARELAPALQRRGLRVAA